MSFLARNMKTETKKILNWKVITLISIFMLVTSFFGLRLFFSGDYMSSIPFAIISIIEMHLIINQLKIRGLPTPY